MSSRTKPCTTSPALRLASTTLDVQEPGLCRSGRAANYTGAPVFGSGTKTADQWFNPAAFATPASYTFGNVGRNTVYGPGMQTLDTALERVFPISETTQLQFRGEFLNALNQTSGRRTAS